MIIHHMSTAENYAHGTKTQGVRIEKPWCKEARDYGKIKQGCEFIKKLLSREVFFLTYHPKKICLGRSVERAEWAHQSKG